MIRSLAFFPAAPLVTAALFGFLGSPAKAQLSAWLDFDGEIPGEATDTRHRNWIEVQSFSIGSGRGISTGLGRETSEPSISEFSLVKPLDQATPLLFKAATTGSDPYPMVTLDLNIGSSPVVRIELENVLVTGQSFSASTGDSKPSESVSLNFRKITFTYILPDSKTKYTSYDLATGQADSGSGGGGGGGSTDTDADGMPDSWETLYGLSVGANDANGDLDGDGLSNINEYQLGTHPASGSSFFKATLSPDPATPGKWLLTWNSVAGKTYIIEWSPDLATPFTSLRAVTASSTSTTEPIVNNGTFGFYRVRPQ